MKNVSAFLPLLGRSIANTKFAFAFLSSCKSFGQEGFLAGNSRTVNPLLIHTQAGAMQIPSPAHPVHFHCCCRGRAEVIPSDPSTPWPLCWGFAAGWLNKLISSLRSLFSLWARLWKTACLACISISHPHFGLRAISFPLWKLTEVLAWTCGGEWPHGVSKNCWKYFTWQYKLYFYTVFVLFTQEE